MTKFLLAVHVLAVIIAIGPVTVASSMFPAAARRALPASGKGQVLPVVRTLHRICRVYAAVGVLVPVFGLATAGSLGVLGDTWLIASIVLTVLAAAVLVLFVLPRQGAIVAGLGSTATVSPEDGQLQRAARRLALYTGMFNVLWVAVTVLMIVRPGSTTGV